MGFPRTHSAVKSRKKSSRLFVEVSCCRADGAEASSRAAATRVKARVMVRIVSKKDRTPTAFEWLRWIEHDR